MAKIKTSALVADIKGTVGGNVFASNKGGNYVRRYKKPTNANTAAQQNVRSLFGANSGEWRQLTENQRNSWTTGAPNFPYVDSLGETRIYSGQQLFNSLNNNLKQAGLNTLLVCPTPQSFTNISILTVSASVNNTALIIPLNFVDSGEVPTGFNLIIEATTILSAGISKPSKSLFKKIIILSDGEDTVTNNYISSYNSLFGSLVAGDVFFVSFKLVSYISGEASVPVTAKLLVA